MAKVNENGALATHMRVDHTDNQNRWKQYENHDWIMEWHLTIHAKKDLVSTYFPKGLSVFIRREHDHTMDELLKYMKEGIE